jgi:exodeoxyribonuclease V gamma subunit
MFLHRSNRTELLFDALAEVVALPPAGRSILEPEPIVVLGRGMERWLERELAKRFGIWANPAFPFPRTWLDSMVGEGESVFDPDALAFAVAAILPRVIARPAFAPLAAYLAKDPSCTRLESAELSERIAAAFDRYLAQRPEGMAGWERGEAEHWQAELWRELVREHGSNHLATRIRRATEAPRPIGDRVCFFGLSALPRVYLEFLAAMSARTEVHLFVLAPSREYWADVRSERTIAKAVPRSSPGELHLERGHPLLAALGRAGRDFLRQLFENELEGDDDRFVRPARATLLGILQDDMLLLSDPRAKERVAAPERSSLAIHVCHSPMREVEVLFDQLVAAFEELPDLVPEEVVVMTPDIHTYAPYIEAVFGSAFSPSALSSPALSSRDIRIPFRIADRGFRSTHAAVDGFVRLLEMLDGRFGASEMLDLLSVDAVRRRLELGAEDVELVREWILETGIRWGIDAAHRRDEGQPECEENTWRFGLDRIFLGFAMEPEGALYRGKAPYGGVDGAEAAIAGRVAELVQTIASFRDLARRPRTFEAWRDELTKLVVATMKAEGTELEPIAAALESLASHAKLGRFDREVPLETLRGKLVPRLSELRAGNAFLQNGVSFCELVPMRTIPFRVVALLGMSDESFPRRTVPLGFDLVAGDMRLGDHNPRDEDRFVFLEAILAVRERMIVTYVGRNVRDNAALPPSVVVSDLLRAVEETFADGEAVARSLVVEHPLQAFSPRYFESVRDPRLFSYSVPAAAGARALEKKSWEEKPFLIRALDPPELERDLPIEELEWFFQGPQQSFARRRLGVHLGRDEPIVHDREPIDLDALEEWEIGSDLLDRRLQGEDATATIERFRAEGRLPLGMLGRSAFARVEPVVDDLMRKSGPLFAGEPLEPIAIDLPIGEHRLTGVIRGVWPSGQARVQYSRLKRRSELRFWIRHLVLSAIDGDHPKTTAIVGRGDGPFTRRVTFDPVPNAREELAKLVALYRAGACAPLPLFQSASRAYAENFGKNGSLDAAREAARGKFYAADPAARADETDPYVRLVFGGVDALASEPVFEGVPPEWRPFPELAWMVFAPLLKHRNEDS